MYLQYINRFRGVAILFVIIGHCVALIYKGDVMSRVLSVIWVEGTTMFLLISGFLFQHLKHKYETGKFYKNKVSNVLAPYILISIPAILMYVLELKKDHQWILTPDFYALPSYSKVFMFYLTGAHLGPLWYIPMIFLFFLIAPLLLKIDKHSRLYWLLPFLLILSFLIPRPENNSNPIQAFVHYLSIYLLGMFMSRYKKIIFNVFSKKAILGTVVAFTIFLSYLIFLGFSSLFFVQKILLSAVLIYLLFRFEGVENKLTKKTFSSLDYLGAISFGLFFLHGYLLGALKMGLSKLQLTVTESYWSVVLLIIIIFTIFFSTLAIVAIQKIFGKRSRKLIGC